MQNNKLEILEDDLSHCKHENNFITGELKDRKEEMKSLEQRMKRIEEECKSKKKSCKQRIKQ